MCPACLTTAALAVAGVTSADGLATLVVRKARAKQVNPTTQTNGGQDGSSKSCVAS